MCVVIANSHTDVRCHQNLTSTNINGKPQILSFYRNLLALRALLSKSLTLMIVVVDTSDPDQRCYWKPLCALLLKPKWELLWKPLSLIIVLIETVHWWALLSKVLSLMCMTLVMEISENDELCHRNIWPECAFLSKPLTLTSVVSKPLGWALSSKPLTLRNVDIETSYIDEHCY